MNRHKLSQFAAALGVVVIGLWISTAAAQSPRMRFGPGLRGADKDLPPDATPLPPKSPFVQPPVAKPAEQPVRKFDRHAEC